MCVCVGERASDEWSVGVVLWGGEVVETRPVDFPDGQIPVQQTSPACSTHASSPPYRIYVYKIYGYFRTTLAASFKPLISRVGQTIRRPLYAFELIMRRI